MALGGNLENVSGSGRVGGALLCVATNYHPHDVPAEQWPRDIALMQRAGIKAVRLGHLAWDSYEPADGTFDFAWFDRVMDLMQQAGIRVILDLAVRPAPLWLHRKCPTISITDTAGNRLYPNHRYMEDVGDPDFQQHALRFVDAMTRRYGSHPALTAFGLDNEPGDGPISYSETVRQRYLAWLRRKYTTAANLNQAWAGHRWSRKIGEFEEVGLPMSGAIAGAPERMLDFRRFVSDEVNGFLDKMVTIVRANAPKALTTGNMWFYSDKKYFDYAPLAYGGQVDRGGCGFYPGTSLVESGGVRHALCGIARIQYENTTPFWCTEFTTATAVPGSIRKTAYASLMLGNQMVCAWTWQTMHAGEEQYLQGMVEWDGLPNRKYDEYRQLGQEFAKIEEYGFPYQLQADVALAFDFPSQIVSLAYPERHDHQVEQAFDVMWERSVDCRVVDIGRSELKYKLLVVPGVALMDNTTAGKIRRFVEDGGTVVMTAGSAMVDERNQVFGSTRPGLLADVFGIRLAGMEEPAMLNELSPIGLTKNALRVAYAGQEIATEAWRFDVIEPRGAQVVGSITSLQEQYPIITSNRFGRGTAVYVGLPAQHGTLAPLVDELIGRLGIHRGPATPEGVVARQVDDRHILYLNLTGESRVVQCPGKVRSVLDDSEHTDSFTIGAFEPVFVETP